MNKTEFLAASLPYNLQMVNKDMYGDEPLIITGVSFDDVISKYGRTPIKFITPIIRPLDSLVKECVQADYNEGKPFIPIVELAKFLYKEISWTGNFILEYDRVQFDSYESYNEFWYSIEHKCFMTIMNDEDVPVHNQLHLFQQLLKWHFWPNMPEGEDVIYVTETFNPYK